MKDKVCMFNSKIKNEIYRLYQSSNLEVLEYLSDILPDHNRKYIQEYLKEKDRDKRAAVFQNIIKHYGLLEYINRRNLGYGG